MKKILLFSCMLSIYFCQAQLIFQDDFVNLIAGQNLSGQNNWTNNSSNGGSGACTGILCQSTQPTLLTKSYLNYGTSSKGITLAPDMDGCGHLFTPVTLGNVYFGFVLSIFNSTVTSNDFFRVCSASGFTTTFRVVVKSAGGNAFYVGIGKGSTGTVVFTNSTYSYDQDHLLIFKYSISSGTSDDVVSAYIDPVYNQGEPANPAVSTASGTDQSSSIDRLIFRQNATGTPSGYAGLVSVAKTWATLTFNGLAANQETKNNFKIVAQKLNLGQLEIQSNIEGFSKIKIYNIQGILLDEKSIYLDSNSTTVSVNPITNSGFYFIEIESENGAHLSQKVVVN